MKACCCVSNSFGSIVTSCYSFVSAIIYFTCGSMIIDLDVREAWKKEPPFALLVFFIFHCFLISALLSGQGLLLLYGSITRKPGILFVWIVLHFIEYIVRVDVFILLIVNSHIAPFEPKKEELSEGTETLVSFFSFTMVFFITLAGIAGDIWAFILVGFRRADLLEQEEIEEEAALQQEREAAMLIGSYY